MIEWRLTRFRQSRLIKLNQVFNPEETGVADNVFSGVLRCSLKASYFALFYR